MMTSSNFPDSLAFTGIGADVPATSVEQHRESSPASVGCAVLTISDTRTDETDTSGSLIRGLLAEAGHRVLSSRVVPDDPNAIRIALDDWLNDNKIDAILCNGGTGIAARDTTYDAMVTLLEKRLDGFGELFRMLSFAEIGSAAMLSRAVAGVARRTVVFAMPGSPNAVQVAMTRLVVPELPHLVHELTK